MLAIPFLPYLSSKHTHGAFRRAQREENPASLLCCSGLHSAASVCQKYIADTAAVTNTRHVLQYIFTETVCVYSLFHILLTFKILEFFLPLKLKDTPCRRGAREGELPAGARAETPGSSCPRHGRAPGPETLRIPTGKMKLVINNNQIWADVAETAPAVWRMHGSPWFGVPAVPCRERRDVVMRSRVLAHVFHSAPH